MVKSDLQSLGPHSNVFTFISAAHGSYSWLDHWLCSLKLHSCVENVSINYDVSLYDNMPVVLAFKLQPSEFIVQESHMPNILKYYGILLSIENIDAYNRALCSPNYRATGTDN